MRTIYIFILLFIIFFFAISASLYAVLSIFKLPEAFLNSLYTGIGCGLFMAIYFSGKL